MEQCKFASCLLLQQSKRHYWTLGINNYNLNLKKKELEKSETSPRRDLRINRFHWFIKMTISRFLIIYSSVSDFLLCKSSVTYFATFMLPHIRGLKTETLKSNSVCNHTSDNAISAPRSGSPICLSRVWLQTKFDDTKSYYQ